MSAEQGSRGYVLFMQVKVCYFISEKKNVILIYVTSLFQTVYCVKHRTYKTRPATYVIGNVEADSRNHCFRWKAIIITYSQRVYVALVIKHATRMRRIILSSVTCLALPHSSTVFRCKNLIIISCISPGYKFLYYCIFIY